MEKEEELVSKNEGVYEEESGDKVDEFENKDVEKLFNVMGDMNKIQTLASKINTRPEKIEAAVAYVKAIIGDDESLQKKVARILMNDKGEEQNASPELAQQAQTDQKGFKILFDSMVAKRVAEITMQLAQEESGMQKQDPLVQLKQRELDLRAMDLQRKAQENMVDQERKGMEFEERLDLDKMKLENNEDQAAERIRIAEEKIDLARSKQDGNKTKN